MRQRSKTAGISVHAIAGTEVVLLGLNATKTAARGLLGFKIFKRGGRVRKERPLGGARHFEGVEGAAHIIQAFQWSDYVVDPKTTYTYRVVPLYGKPAAPREGKPVEVKVKTENPEDKTHAIYFNRGVAGSQAYSRDFGEHRRWYKSELHGRVSWKQFLKPGDVPERAAYKWLSRGLEEAMLAFIGQARGPEYSLRAAVYELTYLPAIQAFVDALESGADVKILHHAKRKKQLVLKGGKAGKNTNVTVVPKVGDGEPETFKSKAVVEELSPDSVARAANKALAKVGLTNPKYRDTFDQMVLERTDTTISHNKFMVLLKNGKPIQVWTGSTNYTAGGIFGQSNVGHAVRDEGVAQKYYEYWQKLATDPKKKSAKSDPPDAGIRNWNVLHQPDLKGAPPPDSMTAIFSPRPTKAMLDWYADRLAAAEGSVFFTAAFSVADEIFNKVIKKKAVGDKPYLRYLLLEGIGGLLKPKYPVMAKCPQNRIAWGETLRHRAGDEEELIETLTGLNSNVNYLHTKYMLIDPLSDDPVVITGSANFSNASTVNNDENMLIIRGNTRVADIFLGEFMRLFNHFRSRNEENRRSDKEEKKHHYLTPNASWTEPYYTEGSQDQAERLLFG